jgi:hypothetical protein
MLVLKKTAEIFVEKFGKIYQNLIFALPISK